MVIEVALDTEYVGCIAVGRAVDHAAVGADAEVSTVAFDAAFEVWTVSRLNELPFGCCVGKDSVTENRITDGATGDQVSRVVGAAIRVGDDVIYGGCIETAVATGVSVSFKDLLAEGFRNAGRTELGANAILSHAW